MSSNSLAIAYEQIYIDMCVSLKRSISRIPLLVAKIVTVPNIS